MAALLSTILHGSGNYPQRKEQDDISCLCLALKEGVPLSRRAIDLAGADDITEFLADLAEQYPGQVVEGGVG
ncbi:hypothetical protein So717_25850 [Roseobacter cerasinus]|uniref:Uncharacterized protein n=1 Tax=Roseobacter cerasinus TaxID=2602289 RepID=A0A640VT42_9RHOB|nr:hypothetical protein [Roseobacter cerasinus]GFE50832.1 hypothetical protein So717_25850 [Roseobacter cerasinus]